MPEGPEVRKYADALDEVLSGRVILSLAARTKEERTRIVYFCPSCQSV